jgi:5-methylcytosine-specific restriction enzyme subunit McrC
MQLAAGESKPVQDGPFRIPIRNLWFLLVYALDVPATGIKMDAGLEASPDLPHLVTGLLARVVERRLHRNLTRSYMPRAEVLTRVRGRIDVLRTLADRTLDRGAVACRFEDLSVDTPRNRFVMSALAKVSSIDVSGDLRRKCASLAKSMGMMGVRMLANNPRAMLTETFGRNDIEDRLMVELARLVYDLAMPTQEGGNRAFEKPIRNDKLLRKIYEKAIGRFYNYHLPREDGWTVVCGERMLWPTCETSGGAMAYLPGMQTDIVIENRKTGRRIVIDTKFADILTLNRHNEERFKSGHIYQMYSYLRSQEDLGTLHRSSEGVLLYPAIKLDIDEYVVLNGHKLRFCTIDLDQATEDIAASLLRIIGA